MAYSQRVPATPRRIRIRRSRAAGLLLVVAAIAAALAHQVLVASSTTASSSSTATSPIGIPRKALRDLRSDRAGLIREDEGAVPDGTSVFDEVPGVANLDPALLSALRQAATRAAYDGVELLVDSGWRSAEYQKRLLQQAILKYGSRDEAARWVASPSTSAHVSGEAVDIGRSDAAAWLSEHGSEYGLCQIYGNESWHFELRHEAIDRACPPMYADPTHDPRMRQG